MIRYYMGRIRGVMQVSDGKKALFEYLESGIVGNSREGHKRVFKGEQDIVPVRMLWRERSKTKTKKPKLKFYAPNDWFGGSTF